MNKNRLFYLLLLGGIALFPSCKKEQTQPLSQSTSKTSIKKVAANILLSQNQLQSFCNINVRGLTTGASSYSSLNNGSELTTPYTNTAGTTVLTFVVSDLGFYSAAELTNYLSGVDYDVNSTPPLGTSLLIAQSNPVAGFVVNGYSGDPEVMALSTGDGTLGLFSTGLALPSDGSFVQPYPAGTDQNVAGWEFWDGSSNTGSIVLLVSNRFAVYVTGTTGPRLDNLVNLLSQFDFSTLESLSAQ